MWSVNYVYLMGSSQIVALDSAANKEARGAAQQRGETNKVRPEISEPLVSRPTISVSPPGCAATLAALFRRITV